VDAKRGAIRKPDTLRNTFSLRRMAVLGFSGTDYLLMAHEATRQRHNGIQMALT
jgi:hypothetical protein